MKIRKILISLFIVIVSASFAQQQAQYSMYMMNNFLVNPAAGGTEEFVDLKIGYRTQWVGIDNNALAGNRNGSPKTIFLSGHSPLGKKTSRFDDVKPLAHHGVGGVVAKDVVGLWDVLNVKGSYSYHLPVSRELMVSFGAFVGIKQYKYDGASAEYAPEYTGETDPLFSGSQTKLLPDASFGIWAYTKDYYVGVSSFQLFGNKMNLMNSGSLDTTNVGAQGSLARHYWLTAGYKIGLSEQYFLVPSFVVKYASPAVPQVDINAKFKYEDKAWLGVSYRNMDAVVGMLGVTYKKRIDLAYAYDLGLSKLNQGHSGSHEILVGLRLPHHEQEPPPAQFW